MITIFASPKKFIGHDETTQRNALQSWSLLRPECDIILLGDDEGTAEAAQEFGARHIPNIPCTPFGTPRVDSMFTLAEEAAKYEVLCYVNADIILMSDFMDAVQQVVQQTDWFIMSAQRVNVDITESLDFDSDWERKLRMKASQEGKLGFRTGVDFWVFSKGLLAGMPPFGVGRTYFDQWLFYQARMRKAQLVDATPVIMDVHQNHQYAYHPQGVHGVYHGEEHLHNRELAGGRKHLFIIKDRTHLLTKTGLKPARDAWRLWRTVRTFQVLYPKAPLPIRVAMSGVNKTLDAVAHIFRTLRLTQPYDGPQSVLKN